MTVVEVSVCQTAGVTGAFVMSRALQRTHFCASLLLFLSHGVENGKHLFYLPNWRALRDAQFHQTLIMLLSKQHH